jgi:hypothetical protein
MGDKPSTKQKDQGVGFVMIDELAACDTLRESCNTPLNCKSQLKRFSSVQRMEHLL